MIYFKFHIDIHVKLINKNYFNIVINRCITCNSIYTWVQRFECSSYAYILSTFWCKAHCCWNTKRSTIYIRSIIRGGVVWWKQSWWHLFYSIRWCFDMDNQFHLKADLKRNPCQITDLTANKCARVVVPALELTIWWLMYSKYVFACSIV